jgi:FkbM family methyltransferase
LKKNRFLSRRNTTKMVAGLKRLYWKIIKWTEGDLGVPIRSDVPLERLDSPYGGWIIPRGRLKSNAVCYLVGAGEDISFDLAVSDQYGCAVHIFDPTPRAVEHVLATKSKLSQRQPMPCATSPSGYYPEADPDTALLMQLHPFGIWSEDKTLRFFAPKEQAHVSYSLVNLQKSDNFMEVPVRRLSGVMRELGHQQIDLLKIDTEGAEYQILEAMLQDQLEVNIICIEFDETASNHIDRHYLRRIKQTLTALMQAGYTVVAKEPDCRNYTLMHARCFSADQTPPK